MVSEQAGKAVNNIVDSLRPQPLAIALILINVIFLFGGGWVIHDVAERTSEGNARRDKMLVDIMSGCNRKD